MLQNGRNCLKGAKSDIPDFRLLRRMLYITAVLCQYRAALKTGQPYHSTPPTQSSQHFCSAVELQSQAVGITRHSTRSRFTNKYFMVLGHHTGC